MDKLNVSVILGTNGNAARNIVNVARNNKKNSWIRCAVSQGGKVMKKTTVVALAFIFLAPHLLCASTGSAAEQANIRGVAHAEAGNHALAIADFTRAIRLDPNFLEAYFNRGNSHAEVGDHDLAIADFTQVIRLNPNYWQAYYGRSRSHGAMGNLRFSLDDLLEGKRRTPLPAIDLGPPPVFDFMGQ